MNYFNKKAMKDLYAITTIERLKLLFKKTEVSIDTSEFNDFTAITSFKRINDKIFITSLKIIENKPKER